MANVRAIVVKGRVNAITVGRPGPPGPGVQEYANLAAFPATGTTGMVYLAQDTGLIYRWTGAAYATIGGAAYEAASQAEAEAGTEAGLRSWSPVRVWQAVAAKVAAMFGTTAGTICQGNDARLSDARTPTAHKGSHETGGGDALTARGIGGLPDTEDLVETAIAYNSSSLSHSGQVVDCTAALTITLETYSQRGEGFQFGVIASGGEVTFSGTFDSKSGYTRLAQGDTAWVVRKSGKWHVAGLSS